MFNGIDTAARITAASAEKLRANGLAFAGRYLGPARWGKTITPREADALRAAGLAVLLCWESTAARMRGGAAAGTADGESALRCARELGAPEGTVIFFACDYNAPAGELCLCEQYVRAARAALGGAFEAGVYGPEKVVAYLSERGACRRFWQCCAWSERFLPAAEFRQYAGQDDAKARSLAAALGLSAVDLDAADTLSGLWQPEEKKPWYAETVAWAAGEGIMDGTRPEEPATRAEVAQMLRNCLRRFASGEEKL